MHLSYLITHDALKDYTNKQTINNILFGLTLNARSYNTQGRDSLKNEIVK